MTDVQMSDARRIGFTALALVAFWVLALRAYWTASDLWHEFRPLTGHPGPPPLTGSLEREVELMVGVGWEALPLIGLSMALIPTAFLHVSTANRLLGRTERWVWIAGVGFVCACGYCYWLGEHDAGSAYSAVETVMLDQINTDYAAQHLAARRSHQVSVPLLFLPIILTTASVLFGALRSAVRDAAVEAVGEDGCRLTDD
jgi:hypothetical protein